jgi:hypothetical protein
MRADSGNPAKVACERGTGTVLQRRVAIHLGQAQHRWGWSVNGRTGRGTLDYDMDCKATAKAHPCQELVLEHVLMLLVVPEAFGTGHYDIGVVQE